MKHCQGALVTSGSSLSRLQAICDALAHGLDQLEIEIGARIECGTQGVDTARPRPYLLDNRVHQLRLELGFGEQASHFPPSPLGSAEAGVAGLRAKKPATARGPRYFITKCFIKLRGTVKYFILVL